MASKIIDHLTEDEPISGQQFVCLSFVLPEGKVKNCSLSAIKIRGVFNKIEDANTHAENLRKKDPDFDIYVGEVGKWLPLNPDPNTIQDERYQEKELNHIISNYKKSRDDSKTIYDERKKEMMKKIAIEEQEKKKSVKNRLQKKLEQKQIDKIVGETLEDAIAEQSAGDFQQAGDPLDNGSTGEIIDQLDMDMDVSKSGKSKVDTIVDKINNRVLELENERKLLKSDLQMKEQELKQIVKEYSESA